MSGWDGESVKDHVVRAQNVAGGADALAHEVSDKVEGLEGRVADLEAGPAQRQTTVKSTTERWQEIDSDIVPMAKIVEALAAHVAQTYDKDKLQALGGKDDLLSYIQNISTGVEAMLLNVADDIRALADREKGAVYHG